MQRRKAVIAMLAATVGLMSRRATMAAESTKDFAPAVSLADWNKPQTVTFDLASFERFVFHLGDEKVSLTSAEIFAALRE